MRLASALAVVIAVLGFTTAPAAAHVLIRDDAVNIGAVLHINPDDDPVAGQKSELYFDIQDANSEVRIPYSGYELLITNEAGETTTVKTEVHGSNVLATYIFPSQGLYRLNLKTSDKYDAFQKVSLRYSLRVDRGLIGLEKPTTYPWTTPLIIGSLAGLAVIGILVVNNRRQIFRQSTW